MQFLISLGSFDVGSKAKWAVPKEQWAIIGHAGHSVSVC